MNVFSETMVSVAAAAEVAVEQASDVGGLSNGRSTNGGGTDDEGTTVAMMFTVRSRAVYLCYPVSKLALCAYHSERAAKCGEQNQANERVTEVGGTALLNFPGRLLLLLLACAVRVSLSICCALMSSLGSFASGTTAALTA